MKKIKVKIPDHNEQQKIGSYFEKLDRMIELQEKKIYHWNNLKKGYLQKMFIDSNEKFIPDLRFNNFETSYKKNKLNKYLEIPDKEIKKVTNKNEIMTLKLNLKGLTKGSNRYTLTLNATKYYVRHKGQFIYGKQNFFYGSMAIITKEFDGLATSGDVPSLNIKNIKSNFLFYYLSRKIFWELASIYSNGTGSKRLHEKNLLNLFIYNPSTYEQQKIGSFFEKIDEIINLNNQKLEHLKQLKKGYLQNMFC